VGACVSFPVVETAQACRIEFGEDTAKTEEAIRLHLHLEQERCGLTEEDLAVLTDFVRDGYSVREQAEEWDRAFLKSAEDANADRPADCLAYRAVARKGRWTGYVETGFLYDATRGCSVPKCASTTVHIRWNELEASPATGR
jgi:hypothetical protein